MPMPYSQVINLTGICICITRSYVMTPMLQMSIVHCNILKTSEFSRSLKAEVSSYMYILSCFCFKATVAATVSLSTAEDAFSCKGEIVMEAAATLFFADF